MADNLNVTELRDILRKPDKLTSEAFRVLRSIAVLVNDDDQRASAREMVLRALEHRSHFDSHRPLLDALAREMGYFPYCNPENLGLRDLFAYEFHRPLHLCDIVFHREQAIVYRRLLAGESIILSAPTSFGKSRIIDAMIATQKFHNIAVIVPTLALIDETRRRLAQFGDRYKIITHLSQAPTDRNIFVLTAERTVGYEKFPKIDFLVVDEFYKLDALDEDRTRTVALNHAFYRLRKDGTQFYLLGPNIRAIPQNVEGAFQCSFFRTSYSTVVTEEHSVRVNNDDLLRLVELANSFDEPTLIFCRSPLRVNEVAHTFLKAGVGMDAPDMKVASDWANLTYHPDWIYGKALLRGIGIHHGRLPRALAQYAVRAFNNSRLRFLICTTTLIEGVNTKAKNVVVFDNTIAKKKVDFFTFNNIRGRSGRMFEHFVGSVYVFHDPPEEELPFVDFPLLTQDDRVPESLLIQIEEPDLSDHARGRMQKFADQMVLPIEVLRKNSTVDPESQIALARLIELDPVRMAANLAWTGFPSPGQLIFVCQMIWEHLVPERRRAGVSSGAQLAHKIRMLRRTPDARIRVLEELRPGQYSAKSADEAVERVLEFDRTWANFELPKFLMTVSRIQESVLKRLGMATGDYSFFAGQCECLFRDPVSMALDEYGIPLQVAIKLRPYLSKTDDLDDALAKLRALAPSRCNLGPFEIELLKDAQAGI